MVRKKQRKDKEMAERQEQAGGSGESETRVVNKATSSWSMFCCLMRTTTEQRRYVTPDNNGGEVQNTLACLHVWHFG